MVLPFFLFFSSIENEEQAELVARVCVLWIFYTKNVPLPLLTDPSSSTTTIKRSSVEYSKLNYILLISIYAVLEARLRPASFKQIQALQTCPICMHSNSCRGRRSGYLWEECIITVSRAVVRIHFGALSARLWRAQWWKNKPTPSQLKSMIIPHLEWKTDEKLLWINRDGLTDAGWNRILVNTTRKET